MDQPTDKPIGVNVNYSLLPAFELDRASVFRTRSVLRKEAGPVHPVRVYIDSPFALLKSDVKLVAANNGLNGPAAFADQAHVLLVLHDREAKNPFGKPSEVAVAEVETE